MTSFKALNYWQLEKCIKATIRNYSYHRIIFGLFCALRVWNILRYGLEEELHNRFTLVAECKCLFGLANDAWRRPWFEKWMGRSKNGRRWESLEVFWFNGTASKFQKTTKWWKKEQGRLRQESQALVLLNFNIGSQTVMTKKIKCTLG